MKKLKLFLLSVFLLFSFCIISQNNQTDIIGLVQGAVALMIE